LGCYSPLPNKTGSLKVHPYVGFIRNPIEPENLNFNPDEVSHVFTLPLEYLVNPDVRSVKQFRESKHKYTVFKVPGDFQGEKEIWGLTSFILDGTYVRRNSAILLITVIINCLRCASKNHARTLSLIS
jgi:nudix motif 8